jgi:hypothetical protein
MFAVVVGVSFIRLVLKGIQLTQGMSLRGLAWPITVLILGIGIVFVLIQAVGLWQRVISR